MSDWLTRAEAAKLAGTHPNTIRGWERRGLVHAQKQKIRGVPTVVIPRAEVEAIVRSKAPKLDAEPVRVAGLEAEVRVLREALDIERARADRLLDAVLSGKETT